MSPVNHAPDEPTNADLRDILTDFRKTVDERLDVVEYHLVDKRHPQKTLPIRVQKLESLAKAIKWAFVTVIGGTLVGAGSWIWDSLKRGHP